MQICLFVVLSILVSNPSHAENHSISEFDRVVLDQIFTLRAEEKLGKLSNDSTLNVIAKRVADANLDREEKIEHRDAEGKTLTQRAEEEGYPGHAGEIVSVLYVPCEIANSDEVGSEFREAIRNSPPHYRGIMAKTGTSWDQFGYAIQSKQEQIGKGCWKKFSLGLVLGKQP